MRPRLLDFFKTLSPKWLLVPAGAAVAVALWLTADRWRPTAAAFLSTAAVADDDHGGHDDHADDPHAGHDHGPDGAENVLRLSEQARGTLGLETAEVALSRFERAVTVPGIVAERPGSTHLLVAAPMTGVVTDVFVAEGQAVAPGDPLFVLRLTHEDVVQAQTEYLKTLEALDVETREIGRLKTVSTRGVVAGKAVLEREYEKRKLEGLLKAQRQSLLLHGLAESQVAAIDADRDLIREIRVDVPDPHDPADPDHGDLHGPVARGALRDVSLRRRVPDSQINSSPDTPPTAGVLTVERLTAGPGEPVTTDTTLAELSDLSLLYIEGRAFESDAAAIARAAREDLPVTALPTDGLADAAEPVAGLQISHVANRVDPDSRALPFYVLLPNAIARDAATPAGRFVTWRYKPGQRVRLRVPVEAYENVIVLPVDAVAEAGAERYVFVENGAAFERRPVRVNDRDGSHVVIADDGSLLPGETVAVTAAHQLQMALKNAAGGAIDPHAGHNH